MKGIQFGLIFITLILNGCVTGTRSIQLNSPGYSNEKSTSGPIYIGVIEDKRTFEDKPRNPSTPSVTGNLSSTPKEKLSTLIGRQRNGYGKAMGDVALSNGGTVQGEVRKLLTKGLESRGYEVVSDINTPKKVTVDIDKFWAWFSPGMWTISFESKLQTKVSFAEESKERTFDVTGYGINKGQVASNANWELAYQRAFLDFLENLDKILDSEDLYNN